MKATAYTDGSCYWKVKLGGYGVFIEYDNGTEQMFNKGLSNTSTGRVELHGMIRCLEEVPKDVILTVYCDSEYVVKCASERKLFLWERSNFLGLKNQDLLKRYLNEFRKFKVSPRIRWIKGHTKNKDRHSLGNAIVDTLADYKQFKEYEEDIRE